MSSTTAVPSLRVEGSPLHGKGVFAARHFAEGEVIERCPVLALEEDEAVEIAGTLLGSYVYEWGEGSAVALGFGSLYNHSIDPNAYYEMHYDDEEIWIVAWEDIPAGTEVLVNYNGDPDNTAPVWFEEDDEAPADDRDVDVDAGADEDGADEDEADGAVDAREPVTLAASADRGGGGEAPGAEVGADGAPVEVG